MDYYIDSHTHITNEELDFDLYLEDVKKAKDSGVKKSQRQRCFKGSFCDERRKRAGFIERS